MMRKTLVLAAALTLAHAAQAAVFDTPEAAAAAAKQALIDVGAPAAQACINRTLGGQSEIVLIGTDSEGKTHYAELRYRDDDERFVLDVHNETPSYLQSAIPGTQSLDADCQTLP